MLPPPGLHFEHPKKVHSAGFLRTANALVHGSEISFLAFTLLGCLRQDPDRIWIDTSSIASLAYAIISLRQQLDKSFNPPPVDSFSSYDGIESTNFEHASSSIFLISATATGGLARKIMHQEGLESIRVINLFSGTPDRTGIHVHCDVATHPSIIGGRDRSVLDVAEAERCPWCRNNSRVIRIVGDQFLADSIQISSALIVEADAPKGLAANAKAFSLQGAFGLNRHPVLETHEFWIDVEHLLKQNAGKIRERVAEATARYVPFSVSHILSLEDPASQELANVIEEAVHGSAAVRPLRVRMENIHSISAGDAKGIVVAAGCIGSGNQLQSVSRDLREAFGSRPRTYLTAFAKYVDQAREKAFVADLAHNGDYFAHQVVFLYKMGLPGPLGMTAWEKEAELISGLLSGDKLRRTVGIGFVDAELDQVRQALEQRMIRLNASTLGRAHDLFAPTPRGEVLKLRPGFAFWKKHLYDTDSASHGDVLATISIVLQNMRLSPAVQGGEPKLAATPFNLGVLSPGNFGRYNDGIVQAALLRAALPHELNYQARPDLSGEMVRIIERTIDRWNDSQGEACIEFLLSIATRRLTLTGPDLSRLRQKQTAGPAPVLLRGWLGIMKKISIA
jgi:hypothetical protein